MEDNYDPEDDLSIHEVSIHEIYDNHCIYTVCKGESGNEWCYMHAFTITLTLFHAILPMTNQCLLDEKIKLLKNKLGLDVWSETDMEVDESWQHKDPFELK